MPIRSAATTTLSIVAAALAFSASAQTPPSAPPASPPAKPAATAPASPAAPAGKTPAASAASALRIERLVPQETILAASIDDWSDFQERVKRTPLWGLWQTKEVQDAVAKLYQSQTGGEGGKDETLDKTLEEIGLTREKIVMPEGTVAFALFMEMDEEIGQPKLQSLVMADFGANADKAQEMFDAVLAKAAENDVKPEEKEIRGRTVKSFPLPEDAPDADADADEEDEEEFEAFGGGVDPSALFNHIQNVHFCRDKERYFVSTSLVALEDALEVVDGQKLSAPLEGDADFQKAIVQLGETKHAWAVLLTKSVQPLIGAVAGGPEAMVLPFVGKLFGDIRAYSFGLGVDVKDGMAEQAIGIYAPAGKVGLLALLESKAKGTLPRHVGPDAIGYGRLNVKFAGLMPLVNDFVKSIPPAFAEQVELQLQQFGPPLEKAFGDLGPEVHVATSLTEPLTAESERTSVAIRAERTENVKPMLDMFSPMAGLAPQDFLGNTIWADEFAPMAVGLGGGWLLLGDQNSVEGALRAAGQKDLASLAEDKGFKRAYAIVPEGDLVGWGWQNTVAGMRYSRLAAKAEMEELKQILGEEAAKELEAAGMDDVMEAITPELVGKYVGPFAWWMKSVDDGFVYRSVIMAPE